MIYDLVSKYSRIIKYAYQCNMIRIFMLDNYDRDWHISVSLTIKWVSLTSHPSLWQQTTSFAAYHVHIGYI